MTIPPADDDEWATAEGTMNGRPSFIRFRPRLQSHLGNPDYPRRLTIFWDYEDDNTSGMPSPEEIDEMRVLEDALIGALDPERLGIVAYVYTCAGTREWHFYVNDVSEVEISINQALGEFPKFPIDLQIEDDPGWDNLQEVYSLCN